ncbi:hypothetical protein [Qingshengfaniella alkalisoli]|uniref:DUF2846 domain-containing protein n=1 Tax=Qingshengfaniella alkalisoli TaxID=2599296 RepID=A0A5B8J3E0_9RHOB|nr:hypothetical protein [Qingshengfaniella alkalisoli]QDY71238.1 hypothetical protein FPZ52_16250 [Qingshengfaniella alkalisoli]
MGLVLRQTMAVALAAMLFGATGIVPLSADTPRTGLMWNRSGLPAAFPLQVKTPSGQNYFLVLRDAENDRQALAAYINGGEFFKVLVPPGRFTLQFAIGQEWQGEDTLFGPDAQTRFVELGPPLTFKTRGIGTKAGHIVEILRADPEKPLQISIREQAICQTVLPPVPSPDARDLAIPYEYTHRPSTRRIRPVARPSFADDPLADRPADADRTAYRYTAPGYELYSNYCD